MASAAGGDEGDASTMVMKERVVWRGMAAVASVGGGDDDGSDGVRLKKMMVVARPWPESGRNMAGKKGRNSPEKERGDGGWLVFKPKSSSGVSSKGSTSIGIPKVSFTSSRCLDNN
ncbi:hypothetical protein Tco_0575908 [Tanacetum coccineum]